MATTVSFNGTTYSVPASGERNWASLSTYLIAIASGALSKAGGSFTLTAADVDFGATYGLKAMKFSSRSTPATVGLVRLGNAEYVAWRNAANSADLGLRVNSSNVLEFNGNPLLTLALGAADTGLVMNAGGTAYTWAKIANANIDAAAAIAYSKLAALTASRALVSDGSGVVSVATTTATEIGYVNGVTSAIQTQLNAKQASDATLTALAAFNTNGLLTQTAADTFAGRTLAVGSAKLTVSNGDGVSGNPTFDLGSITGGTGIVAQTAAGTYSARTLTASNTAGTGLSVTNGDGVSGAPAFNFNPANITIAQVGAAPLTTKGDLLTYSSAVARLGVGANGTVLMADSAETTGLKWAAVAATVTTTRGDLIKRGAVADEPLAIGAANRLLKSDGTDPSWTQIDSTAFFAAGAAATSSAAGTVSRENDVAEGNLSVSFGGGTWAGIDTAKYKAVQVGKRVDFWFHLEGAVAASGLTNLSFALPGAAGTPAFFSTTGNSEFALAGTGLVSTGVGTEPAAARVMIYKDGSGNPHVYLYCSSISAKLVLGHITFFVS